MLDLHLRNPSYLIKRKDWIRKMHKHHKPDMYSHVLRRVWRHIFKDMLGDSMVISVSDRDQFPGFLHELGVTSLVPNQHRDASALHDVQQF